MSFVDDLIVPAMRGRGALSLPSIYGAVKARAHQKGHRLSPSWRATVRNTLQRHTSSSAKCFKRQLFVHHNPGVWEHRP
jgi:hypothetical protein